MKKTYFDNLSCSLGCDMEQQYRLTWLRNQVLSSSTLDMDPGWNFRPSPKSTGDSS